MNHHVGLHNISSDPRDINYWSEVSILRQRREQHTIKMHKILKRNSLEKKSLEMKEVDVLKKVDVLEEQARERMGNDQYSMLRNEMASPMLQPSVAELLVSHANSWSGVLQAAVQSDKKSALLLEKNKKLRERLVDMLK